MSFLMLIKIVDSFSFTMNVKYKNILIENITVTNNELFHIELKTVLDENSTDGVLYKIEHFEQNFQSRNSGERVLSYSRLYKYENNEYIQLPDLMTFSTENA